MYQLKHLPVFLKTKANVISDSNNYMGSSLIDFFDTYNNLSLIKRFYKRNYIFALKNNSYVCGGIWITKISPDIYKISFLALNPLGHTEDAISVLFSLLRNGKKYIYNCNSTNKNTAALTKIGFTKASSEYVLAIELDKFVPKIYKSDELKTEIVSEIKGQQIRCDLQNQIFISKARVPLTIDDIYYDESTTSFIEDGCILLKFKDKYIGYGQIIKDNSHATIVNFGIVKDYRNNGHGMYLLNCLIHIVKSHNFKKIFIKADINNLPALALYKKIGFQTVSLEDKWELYT